jgi:hypothetical protein
MKDACVAVGSESAISKHDEVRDASQLFIIHLVNDSAGNTDSLVDDGYSLSGTVLADI